MSWYEYNEELHLKNERRIAFEEGLEQGAEQERKKTEEQQKIAEEKSRQAERAELEIKRLQQEIAELKKSK